jgi:hypothetical protein
VHVAVTLRLFTLTIGVGSLWALEGDLGEESELGEIVGIEVTDFFKLLGGLKRGDHALQGGGYMDQ